MLQAELKVMEGKHQGKSVPLNVKQFLVGREADCHLRPNSDLVSRHHCVFLVDDYTVRLRDLGSTNGTYVNGERIQGQVVLKPGDSVQIGKLSFQLVIYQPAPVSVPADGAAPEPEVEPVTPPSSDAETVDNILDSGDTSAEVPESHQTVNLDGSTVFFPPPTPHEPIPVAAASKRKQIAADLPVRLPDPESTGAKEVQIGSGGGADKQAPDPSGKTAATPSTAAADIIKNRMRRPGSKPPGG
jgi:pSer/pThr/pTyr-binding forkhead associated (FHA) protein